MSESIEEISLKILPRLVKVAQRRDVITYKELLAYADKPAILGGKVMGYIRDELCLPHGFPILTALAINSDTQLPGSQFLVEGTEHLSDEEYKAKFEQLRTEVYLYKDWNRLLEQNGLRPLEKSADDLQKIAYEYVVNVKGGGEGLVHLGLKEYIACNPSKIGIISPKTTKTEHLCLSGDRCDVLFELSYGHAVVEIKPGSELGDLGDLVRGIYQLVKYRALICAEFGEGNDYPVTVFLVAHDIPKSVSDLAKKFDIHYRMISRELVESFYDSSLERVRNL